MTNSARYYGRSICYSGATIFSTGTVIQVFMANAGIGESAIGMHTAAMNLVNVMASILLSGAAASIQEGPRRYIERIVRAYVPAALCFVLLGALCVLPELPASAVFSAMMLIGMAQSFFIAKITVLEHRLPYLIIARDAYDRLNSVNGLLTGVTSALLSVGLSACIARFPYRLVMLAGFLLSAVLVLFASGFTRSYRVQENAFAAQTAGFKRDHFAWRAVSGLMHSRSFRVLLLPNLLRGFTNGVLGMMAIFALNMGYDSSVTNLLTTVSFAASIAGSLLYFAVSRRMRRANRLLMLVGAAMMGAMLLMRPGRPAVFLGCYALAIIGRLQIDYGVPSRIYELIDSDMACIYHTWRMIVTTLGVTLSSALAGVFIERGWASWLILFAVACQAVSSVIYALYRERAQ